MGNHLTYWNGEADEPNWKEHPVPGQAECWNTLSIEKKVTGYTPLEVYSLEAVPADYLKNVDFINSDDHIAEAITPSAWAYWHSENHSFLVRRVWSQKTQGEEYQYIISEITGGTDYGDDLLMAACRRTEEDHAERYINKSSKIKAFRISVIAWLAEHYRTLQRNLNMGRT